MKQLGGRGIRGGDLVLGAGEDDEEGAAGIEAVDDPARREEARLDVWSLQPESKNLDSVLWAPCWWWWGDG